MSEIKRKISRKAKNNHSRIQWFTRSISYNARTTTCTVLASAAQANTTPMQKPNSVTGLACLSSTVLTVHNILLPAGVISRITLQSLCHRYSDRDVSFYPKIAIISCIGTAVLLVLIYVIKVMRMNMERSITSRIYNFVTFSYVMPLVYEDSDLSPTRAFKQATATQTVITLSCKRYSTRLQNRENLQIQQDSNSTAVEV